LQVQAADSRHLEIEHKAGWARGEWLVEKFLGRAISLDPPSVRTQETAYRPADTGVIVDNKNETIHRYATPLGQLHCSKVQRNNGHITAQSKSLPINLTGESFSRSSR
jgi:hypothetical protein